MNPVVFTPMQIFLYLGIVLGTCAVAAWFAYDEGKRRGYRRGVEEEQARQLSGTRVVPRAFLQRDTKKNGDRDARVGRARIVPRKQITPGPRREKRRKEQ